MTADPREKVRNIIINEVDSEYGVGYATATHEILATLRDALLSEEAVEAGADGLSRDQIDMGLSDLNDHMRNGYVHAARATLSAALAKIRAPHVER